jgi:cell division protein FtsB
MAASSLVKRRELRKLEARRDDLKLKLDRLKQDLVTTRAALKSRRKQA